MNKITEQLRKLSTRKKQAYAAFCIARFANSIQVRHESIDHLLEFLLSILRVDNLNKWEGPGYNLDLMGRGDPMPQNLVQILPKEHRESFAYLVDSAVEVGHIDLYAKSSDQPFEMLCECLKVLTHAGIPSPELDKTLLWNFEDNVVDNKWGSTIGDEDYRKVHNSLFEMYTINNL